MYCSDFKELLKLPATTIKLHLVALRSHCSLVDLIRAVEMQRQELCLSNEH